MNILAFFAHPDDETMLIGGTLALLAREGASVHYLCSTRGEGGELGEPPESTREDIGRVRSQEMSCAVGQLGGASLHFLDYIDPLVGPGDELFAFTDQVDEVVERVADLIARLNIDVMVTHGSNGEYGHPAHHLVYQAAQEVVARLGDSAPLWYSVHANFPEHPRPTSVNINDMAHFVIDISSTLEQKTAAALCHRSQNALFVRKRSIEARRAYSVPEVIQTLESLHRQWPPTDGRPADSLAQLLLQSGAVRE